MNCRSDPYGQRTRELPDGYDTAAVCTAGHMINDSAIRYPQHSTKHCPKCGRPTICVCPACEAPIRGDYESGVISARATPTPPHCHECGEPFPWTTELVTAANNLMAEFDRLTVDDRAHFSQALPDLLTDTPGSTVSAVRVKRLLTKAGEGAADGLWEILKGVATTGASKLIWGV